jgi:hypothetical protein
VGTVAFVLLFKDYSDAYLEDLVIIYSLAPEIGVMSDKIIAVVRGLHPLIVMTSYLKHRMNDPAIVSVCYDYTVSRADIRNIATFFRLIHQKRHLMENASWMGCGWASIARQYEPRI